MADLPFMSYSNLKVLPATFGNFLLVANESWVSKLSATTKSEGARWGPDDRKLCQKMVKFGHFQSKIAPSSKIQYELIHISIHSNEGWATDTKDRIENRPTGNSQHRFKDSEYYSWKWKSRRNGQSLKYMHYHSVVALCLVNRQIRVPIPRIQRT